MDSVVDIEILRRALKRERESRKEAERILEERSMALYEANEKLKNLNESLEEEIQKRIQELTLQEEQLRHLFENNPFPMIIYSYDDLKVIDMNEPARIFYGNSDQILGKEIFKLHPIEEQEEAIATIKKIKQGLPIEFKEWYHLTEGGERKPVELHSSDIRYKNSRARLLLINNITERKRIEKDKELNRIKYQELVEGASDIIYRCNTDGDFIYVNPTGIHITGYTLDELLKMNYLDLIDEEYRAQVKLFYEDQLDNNTKTSYLEIPIVTKKNKKVWIGQNVNLASDEDGKLEINALARDITELKIAKDDLERNESKYRNILENLKLGILEVDLDGKITNAFPKFTELSGYSKDELIGKSPIDFLLPEEHRSTMARQNVKRARGEGSVYEVEILRKDGSRRWVIISGAPFYNSNGEMIGTVGIHLDISERKKIEKELRSAKDLAENSVRLKEIFMANMSHEIRTPMNAILGMTRLLDKTNLDSKQQEYVNALTYSADNLLLIINDILDFSKIDSGNLDIVPVPNNLRKLFDNMTQLMSPKAEERNNYLKVNLDSDIQEMYEFDGVRLNQVFLNLVGNSVKFTRDGEVEIHAKIIENKHYTDVIRFAVKDSGIGISQENLEKIFESFIQADNTTEKEFGGTGLGLAISKKIVKMMGGELMVESEIGVGSEFYFELELKRSENVASMPDVIPDSINFRGLRVLLVEDNEINVFMAKTILEDLQCVVTIAKNGKDALESVQESNFDVVLMDMRMPVMDGITATREIRMKTSKEELPIIALTANALNEDKERCLAAGMNKFLSKPFEKRDLIFVFSELGFDNIDSNQLMESVVDTSGMDKVAGNNVEFKRKMIELFLVETKKSLEEISEYQKNQEWMEISSIAHKLKPSLDYLSNQEMRSLVRSIEGGFKFSPDANDLKLLEQFMQKMNLLSEELSNME